MDYCVTVDMDYVWAHYQSAADDVSVQIRAVTWWIWVSCYILCDILAVENMTTLLIHIHQLTENIIIKNKNIILNIHQFFACQ